MDLKKLFDRCKKQININNEICKILDRDLELLNKSIQNCDDIQENLKQVK